jgi:hypothetical protein
MFVLIPRVFGGFSFGKKMATKKRKSISKKTRFEVFKRDSFKCQYCGQSSPDVILEVDHIDPVSKGGLDEMVNYITACRSCNAGKSDRKLDDNTTLAKQRAQLAELNERREQLEMMMTWRSGIKEIDEIQVEKAHQAWKDVALGWSWNDLGIKNLRAMLKKNGLMAVLDAIETVGQTYIKIDAETGHATQDSISKASSKLPGVLVMQNLPQAERDLHYVKGILRNRLSYVPYDVMRDLKSALDAGVALEDIKLEAKNTRNWTRFSEWLDVAKGVA